MIHIRPHNLSETKIFCHLWIPLVLGHKTAWVSNMINNFTVYQRNLSGWVKDAEEDKTTVSLWFEMNLIPRKLDNRKVFCAARHPKAPTWVQSPVSSSQYEDIFMCSSTSLPIQAALRRTRLKYPRETSASVFQMFSHDTDKVDIIKFSHSTMFRYYSLLTQFLNASL